MAVNTISTRIVLEGGDELLKQLKELGKAGQQSLDQISKAADDVGFKKLGEAGASAADGIAKAGEASQQTAKDIDRVKASTDKASESFKASSEDVKNYAEALKAVASTAATVFDVVQKARGADSLAKTLLKLAESISPVSTAFKLLGPVLGTTAVLAGSTVVAIGALAVALNELGRAAVAVAGPYEKFTHDLQMLAQSSGQSFDSLQRGEALFGQIGLSAEKFRSTVSKVGEELGKLDVSGELKKSADAIVAANKKVLEAEAAVIQQRLEGRQVFLIGEDDRLGKRVDDLRRLKQVQAELNSEVDKAKALEDALLEARQKAAEAAANSLSKVLEKVKAIEAGQEGITFDSLVTAETKVRAFTISMKQAEDAGQNAGAVLVKFIAAADRASAIQIGKQFGLDEEQVDRIQRLGGHLQTVDAIWKRIQSAGVLIPSGSVEAFEKMRTETQATEAAWTRLEQAWQSSIFASIGAGISADVSQIKNGFINLAAATLEAFNNAGNWILDFFNRLPSGVNPAIAMVANATSAAFNAIGGAIEGAINWIGQFISSINGITWDSFASAGVAAWNAIIGAVNNAITTVSDFISKLASIAWDFITSAGVAAWNALTGAINRAVEAVRQFIGLKPSGSSPGSSAAPRGLAGGGLLGGRGTGTSDSNLAWLSRGEYVMPARAVRQPGVLAFLEALRRSGKIPGFAYGGLVPGLEDIEENVAAFEDGVEELTSALSDLAAPFSHVERAMDELRARAEGFRFAGGGVIGGRGSGTSDSNLAWVSRGEHIMPARAVAQPGVLAFLEMLRRSGGDLGRVLDRMGHFATGGLVSMPAFASGGLGGMSHVTIAFPGLPAISGLRASSDVISELQRAAAMAQVRSGGRKPSRYT